MKKIIKFYFLFVFFISPVFAVNIGTVSSKIDWDNSQFIVTKFVPAHGDGPDMSCFGETYVYSDLTPWTGTASKSFSDLGVDSDLASANLTLTDFISTSNQCFRQAGTYTYKVKLVDKAGNEVFGGDQTLTIKSGNVDKDLSLFEITGYQKDGDSVVSSVTCSGVDLVANAKDKCISSLILKDEFGNILKNRSVLGEIINQDITDSYNTILNGVDTSDEAFDNGVRMETTESSFVSGQQKFDSNVDGDGKKEFSFSSYVPSLEIVIGNIPDFLMAKLENEKVEFNLEVTDVNNDGTENSSSETSISNFESPAISFLPQVIAQLSDKEPAGNSPIYAHTITPNDLQFIFGLAKTFYVTVTAGTLIDKLPSNFSVFMKGYSPDSSIFIEEDLSEGDSDINANSPEIIKDGHEFILSGDIYSVFDTVNTKLHSEEGDYDNLKVAFGSKVKYTMDSHDIVYPSGNLGNNVDELQVFNPCNTTSLPECHGYSVSGIIVGADIEGQVLTRNDNYSFEDSTLSDVKLLKVGNVSAKDARENITRNTYELLRGIYSTDASSGIDFNINTGFTSDVAYFKGGLVRISGGEFQGGKRTIVIENGNLFITGDMNYADVSDSLGIILINSVITDYSHGNIFVHKDVQKIIGTYFADGGLVSSDKLITATPAITDGVDVGDRESTIGSFNKQLLLKGTLLTQNTLGGYLLDNLLTPYGKASEVTIGSYLDAQKAILYDLHFLRRYVPANSGSSLVSDNPNCVAKDSDLTECDSNIHSFVIRPDGKVSNQAPPGFDNFSSISR